MSPTFTRAQTPTPEPTPRLAYDDSRYAEYKAIRDRYADLYEEYMTRDADGALRNTPRRQAIRAIVRRLNKAANDLYDQDDFMDQTRPGMFSEELTKEMLGSLRSATDWPADASRGDLKRDFKATKTVGGRRVTYRPYRRYLEISDVYDELRSTLAKSGLTEAQKAAALERLQREVIDATKTGLSVLNVPGTNAPQELIRLLQDLTRKAETLKSQNPQAANDRQAFIRELERYEKELGDSAVAFRARYGDRAIKATYVEAFLKAGRDDWNGYADSWSGSFWVSNVEGQTTRTLFQNPIDALRTSRNHLKNGRPFNQSDVNYYRQRVGELRGRIASLKIVFDQYIQVAGEANADMYLLHQSKTMSEEQFNARRARRQARQRQLSEEIQSLTTEKVFAYNIGEPRVPSR